LDLWALHRLLKNPNLDKDDIAALFDLPANAPELSAIAQNLSFPHNARVHEVLGEGNWWHQIPQLLPDPTLRAKFLQDISGNANFAEAVKAWLGEGGLSTSNTGQIWFRKNGDDIFELKNGGILPNQKNHYDRSGLGNPVGNPVNGYVVVKIGNDLKVRRIPDESSYAGTPYYNRLTEHPNAHVLERHGHDVSDDALIKRANEGIAPDGSTVNQNPPYVKPPYSSKFDSPDALKLAYDNTRPGSPAFQNAVPNGNRIEVPHTLASGNYGKGVPRDGNTLINMRSVVARYENMGNGNWQLVYSVAFELRK